MANHSHDGYLITSDNAQFDLDRVYHWLSEDAYWSKGVVKNIVERSFANSLAFHVIHEVDGQVGVARMVTDKATFAYLADVYIDPKHRRQGLGTFLMDHIVSYPDLQGLRRQMLATSDMHSFYEKYGFKNLKKPGFLMEKLGDNAYSG